MSSFISNALRTARSSSLAMKLLGAILFCSGTMVLLISAVQISWYYYTDVKAVNATMDTIEESLTAPISESLWNLDEVQLSIQIESLLSMPNITYASIDEIIQGERLSLMNSGKAKEDYDVSRLIELHHEFDLVGYLFVAASLDDAKQKLLDNAFFILSSQTIKTLLVSFAIIIILYYMIIRHLHQIAHFAKTLTLERLDTYLTLEGRTDKKDELFQLVNTLNNMNNSLRSEWEKRQRTNEALESERDFSKTVINSSNLIICCLHPDLTIASINPAGAKLTDVKTEELINERWSSNFIEEDSRKAVEERLVSNQEIKDEQYKLLIPSNNQEYVIQWTFVRFFEAHAIKYYIGFGYDITELKNVENAIKRLNSELEAIVEKRTLKLKESNAKLEDAFEELKQAQQTLVEHEKMASLGSLVAGVAHEINTPIGITVTASSFIDEMLKEFEQKVESKQISKSYLDNFVSQLRDSSTMIQNNLKRASELIKSFKQVAVDQSSKAAYQFNVKENIEQVIVSLGHQLRSIDNNVEIKCDPTLEIYSFPGELIQIYTNLIQNSVIHAFDDWSGEKKIILDVHLSDPKTLVIDYRDTGKGIPQEIVDKIFDPFVTTKRGSGGSGLGTHIIYNLIVQLMKGTIVCESNVGQGARFLITVPLEDKPDMELT